MTMDPFRMSAKYRSFLAGIVAGVLAAATLLCVTSSGRADPPPVHTAGALATATHTGDIQVSSVLPNPQSVLITPPIVLDGTPVEIMVTMEYALEIACPTLVSNAIGFDLYRDGHFIQQIGFYGSHQIDLNPEFGPVTLDTVLDAGQTPTAGTHTFELRVGKWFACADAYLRAGDDAAGNGMPMPLRLTVRYF